MSNGGADAHIYVNSSCDFLLQKPVQYAHWLPMKQLAVAPYQHEELVVTF